MALFNNLSLFVHPLVAAYFDLSYLGCRRTLPYDSLRALSRHEEPDITKLISLPYFLEPMNSPHNPFIAKGEKHDKSPLLACNSIILYPTPKKVIVPAQHNFPGLIVLGYCAFFNFFHIPFHIYHQRHQDHNQSNFLPACTKVSVG